MFLFSWSSPAKLSSREQGFITLSLRFSVVASQAPVLLWSATPPTLRLGLGGTCTLSYAGVWVDNPGTDNIDLCRDCIQTSDVFLQVCLSSFWLAGSGRMRILSLCTRGPWWSLIRLSKFLLMGRNCSTCLKTWSGIASSYQTTLARIILNSVVTVYTLSVCNKWA